MDHAPTRTIDADICGFNHYAGKALGALDGLREFIKEHGGFDGEPVPAARMAHLNGVVVQSLLHLMRITSGRAETIKQAAFTLYHELEVSPDADVILGLLRDEFIRNGWPLDIDLSDLDCLPDPDEMTA